MTTVINGSSPSITFSDSTTQTTAFTTTPVINTINSQSATPLTLGINGTEAMRIKSIGNILVNSTTEAVTAKFGIYSIDVIPLYVTSTTNVDMIRVDYNTGGGSSNTYVMPIRGNGTLVGGIYCNGNSSTAFNTSSDYRLKENVTPITDALSLVSQLKPVNFKWKNGGDDNGFIAHEIQAVLPNAVTGEKDATFEDGSIHPQAVDYSKVVATLTAAIQEQQALIESLTTRLTALEAK